MDVILLLLVAILVYEWVKKRTKRFSILDLLFLTTAIAVILAVIVSF